MRRALLVMVTLCLVSLGWSLPAAAEPATLIVGDPDTCAGATYPTITAAVDAAAEDDIISICAGTYEEQVSTGKRLHFRGAQAGVPGSEQSGPETIVHNDSFSFGFGADGVTVDGITFTGSGAPGAGYPFALYFAGANVSVTNCVFSDNAEAALVRGTHNTVSDNLVHGGEGADASTVGFEVDTTADYSVIEDNVFDGTFTNAAVTVTGTDDDHSIGVSVVDNTATYQSGSSLVVAAGTLGLKVTDNTVSGPGGYGILLVSDNANYMIDRNHITGASAPAIAVGDGSSGSPNGDGEIVANDLEGNYQGVAILAPTTGQLQVSSNMLVSNTKGTASASHPHGGIVNDSSATVVGRPNWWGCDAGPSQPGCDAAVNLGSGTLYSSPYLVLSTSFDADSVLVGSSTAFHADLNHDIFGRVVAVPVLDGVKTSAFTFSKGTVEPVRSTFVDGVATTMVNATSTGVGEARSTVDNASRSSSIRVLDSGLTSTVTSARRAEGNTGQTSATFEVTLSRTSIDDQRLSYSTTDGTATAGADYVATTGQLTISAGQTTATVTVPVVGDTTPETDETFSLAVTSTTGAVSASSGEHTITNDDSGVLSVRDASTKEGNSGTHPIAFTVTLKQPSPSAIRVHFTTVAGTAKPVKDYVQKQGVVKFLPGQQSRIVRVLVVGDDVKEPHESFLFNLYGPVGATIDDPNATGVIRNDD